jgi:hypothetical protein
MWLTYCYNKTVSSSHICIKTLTIRIHQLTDTSHKLWTDCWEKFIYNIYFNVNCRKRQLVSLFSFVLTLSSVQYGSDTIVQLSKMCRTIFTNFKSDSAPSANVNATKANCLNGLFPDALQSLVLPTFQSETLWTCKILYYHHQNRSIKIGQESYISHGTHVFYICR